MVLVVLLTTGNPLGHAVNVSRHPIRPDVLHFAEEKPFASWIVCALCSVELDTRRTPGSKRSVDSEGQSSVSPNVQAG